MLVFAPRIKLLLVAILVRILRKISNFRVASFRLGLREVTLSSMRRSNVTDALSTMLRLLGEELEEAS